MWCSAAQILGIRSDQIAAPTRHTRPRAPCTSMPSQGQPTTAHGPTAARPTQKQSVTTHEDSKLSGARPATQRRQPFDTQAEAPWPHARAPKAAHRTGGGELSS